MNPMPLISKEIQEFFFQKFLSAGDTKIKTKQLTEQLDMNTPKAKVFVLYSTHWIKIEINKTSCKHQTIWTFLDSLLNLS